MPFFRCRLGAVYFAHVPKCGGTSVERYLQSRWGRLAFKDGRFLLRPESARWSKSSPQHITVADLEQLFPPGFFALSFAVVRHPVARAISLYRYQRDIVRTLPQDLAFTPWLDGLATQLREAPYALDNHPRPMSEFIPEEARIFRLEDGLQPVADWLDELPARRPAPEPIGRNNSYDEKLARSGGTPGPKVAPTDADRARIAEIYAVDFERFGYELETPGLETESGSDKGGDAPE